MNQNEKSDSSEPKLELPAERAGAALQRGVHRTWPLPRLPVSGNQLSSELPVLQPRPQTETSRTEASAGEALL